MAKKPAKTKGETVVGLDGKPVEGLPAFAGKNKPASSKPFVEDIETAYESIDAIMADAKLKAAPHREEITRLKGEFVEATGRSRRAVTAVIGARRRARKDAERVRKDQDDILVMAKELDDVVFFDTLFDYGRAQEDKPEEADDSI